MDQEEYHDLLIRIDERLKALEAMLKNHLAHHFRYSFWAWTVTTGAIVTLAIALIKLL